MWEEVITLLVFIITKLSDLHVQRKMSCVTELLDFDDKIIQQSYSIHAIFH